MKKPKGKLFALLAIFAAVTLVAASGAFTSVEAERTASVDVAGDSNALLTLTKNTTDGTYAKETSGATGNQLSINLTDGQLSSAAGVNENAVTRVNYVFDIQNNGNSGSVNVYLTTAGNVDPGVITFYHNGTSSDWSTSKDSIVGSTNAVTLAQGNKVSVGVKVDTRGYTGGNFNEQVTVHAEAV